MGVRESSFVRTGSEPGMLETLEEVLAPSHSALVIVDMQKDFCTPGFGAERAGRDLSMARGVIPHIGDLLEGARRAGAAVVHVGFSTLPRHGSDSGSWLAQRRRSTVSAEDLCLTGSQGAQFVEELAPEEDELVVHKRRYSAFTGTDLDLLLRARNVRSLVVTGVSTNVCVETTARAAFELGYYVCVPPDATGSWDRTLHETTLQNIRHRFGLTPTVGQILGVWTEKTAERQRAF